MKKTIVTIFLTLFSVNAMAFLPSIKLEEGDSAAFPLTGKVSVVVPIADCPANTDCAITTEVVIDYDLFGCVDRFASFHNVVRNADNSFDIYVAPMNIANKASTTTYCFVLPTHQQRISLGEGVYSEESVRVHFIGTPNDIESVPAN